ncbi:wall-associated receptor kinase-like 14 [Prosopis cineraria]|uniref:wall-associated receptor kinase-like 14 n=1 Tax=Prosopis cineraria TaxID=364024 RepID=UPI00240F8905|nr:wall-associated receptor kinase-like 14 [Prosopis cineraria]
MITKHSPLILLLVFLLPLIPVQSNRRHCHQTCRPHRSPDAFPYPFGFSSGCAIRLNCNPSAGILIGEYPVHSINSDTIIVGVKSRCNRPFHTFGQLFSHRYAPTSRNAILLQNCSKTVSPCIIPATMVQTRFESKNCSSGGGNLSCYYENSTADFMNLQNLTNKHCTYLMSSIAAEDLRNNSDVSAVTAVSLEVETIELGWWLEGECQCSKDANCTRLKSPIDKKPGYRCRCKEGFTGDGYLAGSGCRKDSSTCNPAKYMSGQCGGATRFVVLIGGMVFGASLMIGLGLISTSHAQWNIKSTSVEGERIGLPWSVRLTIAAETARAIAHLHSAIDPPIYHRDIKSSNILLDNNFRSKVADFGLSRPGMTEISHVSTAPQGTPGYVDPQYHQDFHLSDKSDVYSFGVVLVEILTGLKVVDFTRPQNAVNLASFATDRIGKGLLYEIIDPFLEAHNDDWTHFSIHKVAELAFRCLAFHRDMRPSMTEVAAELEQIRLSRWTTFEDSNRIASTELSSSSPSSDESEKPLSVKENTVGPEGKGLLKLQTKPAALNLMERPKSSPVSVQDPDFWLSEQSSPSSNSLLSKKSFE